MEDHKINPFYPAASQPNTLTAALVEAGHYASISSARASLARSKKGPPETFEITLSGIRDGQLVVCTVLVEKTPARFLEPEKTETDEREKTL